MSSALRLETFVAEKSKFAQFILTSLELPKLHVFSFVDDENPKLRPSIVRLCIKVHVSAASFIINGVGPTKELLLDLIRERAFQTAKLKYPGVVVL